MPRRQAQASQSPMEDLLSMIGGRWKPRILCHLQSSGALRFSEIQRRMPEITQKMLTQQLRQLEEDGFIHRKVYPAVPPKVEYTLTSAGEKLKPVLEILEQWVASHLPELKQLQNRATTETEVAQEVPKAEAPVRESEIVLIAGHYNQVANF